MADFDINFRDEINLAPAGDAFLLEHGEWDINFHDEINMDTAGDGFGRTSHRDFDMNFRDDINLSKAGFGYHLEHGEFDIKLVVLGGTTDILPPEISNITPAPGTNIASTQTIEFDVTDAELRLVAIAVAFPDGTVDLAYDGTSLQGHYTNSPNQVTAIMDGYHFKLVRRGGWIGNPTIKYMALDCFNDAVLA
jgi:hypothetical protein